MSSAAVIEAAELAADDLLVPLQEVGRWLASWVTERDVPERLAVSEAVRVDRIAEVERLQACLEAVKAVEVVGFAQTRALAQVQAGVHPRKAEQGITTEIGLAGRVSPTEGARRLHVARDLVLDMPETLTVLARGEINAGTARRVVEP